MRITSARQEREYILGQDVDSSKPRIGEQWTDSRAAVVLTGHVSDLLAIARQLQLPEDSVIRTRHDQAVLGLWGEPLVEYQELKRRGALPLVRQKSD